MLQHLFLPQIQQDRDDFIFMQEGAPPHFHHKVQQYLVVEVRWRQRDDLLSVCVAKSETAVIVITRELLTFVLLICTRTIVPVTCATCFSCICVNKPSFSIILRVGLFPPYTVMPWPKSDQIIQA
ncbi:hypothetical protein AVEN_168444-1 [Araneus ventricosus]|uniref:Uncharacterized protein n=1 Tax=Araneus ventricosus TaxID=182803 RepID=A0A4Y2GTF3_ARAVE|nr:hypothetical protein AVEN_168444-1 [Araneus ventricosus]